MIEIFNKSIRSSSDFEKFYKCESLEQKTSISTEENLSSVASIVTTIASAGIFFELAYYMYGNHFLEHLSKYLSQ